ncbi:PAS domain S-box protein [Paenibacillus sp. Marseille-Q4541]|uniref:PAS domain S-box protein n=1 Tax=Paenibacillus sp. Marseille-Q4541 TaxID=2831522 RepID=UPI001BAB8750|nr:PAS domain S-box protein [Paenibacillus sp. Marseille-Q4541]
MSIKIKLSLMMSFSLFIILGLNIALSYYTTQENLQQDSEKRTVSAAKQIALAMEQNQDNAEVIKKQISKNLWLSAKFAANMLDPDINKVTTEQLEELSEQTGVTDISLMIQTDDDIIVSKSSDPNEIGLSTRKMTFWYQAFTQLFENHQVNIPQGITFENFWSNGFEYATSDPENINIWGYYHDGKRNYIINPFMNADQIEDYVLFFNPEGIIKKFQDVNPSILSIAGINPITFGQPSMSQDGTDELNFKFVTKPVFFGTYRYGDIEADKAAVNKAIETGNNVSYTAVVDGKKVLKNMIPIMNTTGRSYVISIVTDYREIESVISEQLISHIAVSLVLLEIVIFGSYVFASAYTKPIQTVLSKVNEVGDGHFKYDLKLKRNDELGQLSNGINAMIRNLGHYTNRLKQMYEENRAVKEHLESVINQTADAIHITDERGNIIQVNRAFEQLYGWSGKEIIGNPLSNIPEELMEEECEQRKKLQSGQTIPSNESYRFAKDGSRVEVSVSTAPVRDDEGEITGFISISRDITARKRMEELLRRSEKLTTVGQLAAGVAHEIRNPLTTLRGFIQLQQQTQKMNPRHIDLMLSELDRINLIVGEFLILAKPQAANFTPKDIRFIMGDVISLLDNQAHMLGIEFVLDADIPTIVHCGENQLKQVFINLLKNSMEAMPDGGKIEIQILLTSDHHAEIVIRDEGEGVPEDLLPKLGEPFFTSKESGTGLGLMVSQRLIQAHKGTFEIESEYGKGTTVTIVMPALNKRNSNENSKDEQ